MEGRGRVELITGKYERVLLGIETVHLVLSSNALSWRHQGGSVGER